MNPLWKPDVPHKGRNKFPGTGVTAMGALSGITVGMLLSESAQINANELRFKEEKNQQS